MDKEATIQAVREGSLQLIASKEIEDLRSAGEEALNRAESAEAELLKYERHMAKTKDLVFKCCCEHTPCYYVDNTDPTRRAKEPMYCPKDGKSCRWNQLN